MLLPYCQWMPKAIRPLQVGLAGVQDAATSSPAIGRVGGCRRIGRRLSPCCTVDLCRCTSHAPRRMAATPLALQGCHLASACSRTWGLPTTGGALPPTAGMVPARRHGCLRLLSTSSESALAIQQKGPLPCGRDATTAGMERTISLSAWDANCHSTAGGRTGVLCYNACALLTLPRGMPPCPFSRT